WRSRCGACWMWASGSNIARLGVVSLQSSAVSLGRRFASLMSLSFRRRARREESASRPAYLNERSMFPSGLSRTAIARRYVNVLPFFAHRGVSDSSAALGFGMTRIIGWRLTTISVRDLAPTRSFAKLRRPGSRFRARRARLRPSHGARPQLLPDNRPALDSSLIAQWPRGRARFGPLLPKRTWLSI